MVGELDKGLIEADRAIQMQDDYALGMSVKGGILINQGKHEEGLAMLKKASNINPAWKYSTYGYALIQTGHIQEGKAIIQELESMEPTASGAFWLGGMYTALGDLDKVIEWYRFKNKHAFYPWIRILGTNKELLNDPRFLELIHEMNLPDPAPLVYDPDI